MLTKMILSRMHFLTLGISEYPHPAVTGLYFEIVTRYSAFFETQISLISDVLGSFLDTRGLFHRNQSKRLRAQYLFLRFVRSLRSFLPQYVVGIITSLQPLLVVGTPEITTVEELSVNTDLYVFEAVGYMISVPTIPDAEKCRYLSIIVNPMLGRIETVLDTLIETPTFPLVGELGNIICAIGAISKGFPDFSSVTTTSPSTGNEWKQPFLLTLQAIGLVLERYCGFKSIREAAKFAMQRLSGCIGPVVLDVLPKMVSSGLLAGESSQELLDFLPFISQIIFKFGPAVFTIMNAIWIPLREKIEFYLQQEPNGTDESRILLDLIKADCSLMNAIFMARLNGIFTSSG